ncbi:TetR/AcrR family transcriptional regulator [Streptomyces albiaxialis]|uniref:TetR/AcrR family transcriptional regulator n=1 Tax=Streptomyces albiaxialis TaxID=329523 RepID=A0ABP5HTX2_9ACTN
MAVEEESRRERKKRQTRRHVSDVATRLFMERGFDKVTVAEVAREADVAVNTVYNYFPAKEDLCFPAHETSVARLAGIVRDRAPGHSAADAVFARLREETARRDPALGLTPGFGNWLAMVRAAPTLTARLERLADEMTDALAVRLAEETHAAPDDPYPRLVASLLGWAHAHTLREISARTAAGDGPETVAARTEALLDALEGALSENVRAYARRGAPVPGSENPNP